MLNYTLDPYQRQYTPEAFAALQAAWLQHHRHQPVTTAAMPAALPPELAPLSADELEPLHDRQVALLGRIVAVYQNLCEVFHTAVGLELGTNEDHALPPKPTHAAVVSDVGRRVDELVRTAVVENAWRILHYGSLRELITKEPKNPTATNLGPEPGKAAGERLSREFHFGTPSPEMRKRYRMPNIDEPFEQYRKYLDGLRPNPDGTTTVHRIPTAIRPRPYPEALAVISGQGQEAVRFASELSPQITDIFCMAVRIDLGLAAEGENVDHLVGGLDHLGEAVAILFDQILEATANMARFVTIAPVKAMVMANMLRTPPRRQKRRR
ncbi:MAG: hypothetical protein HYX68_27080 [Planctomycetes bacterium]|nr:hypothetical protein [Planctomycetota bacterium]